MTEAETAGTAMAALLAETLAAGDWWDKFACSPDARQWGSDMAETALLLYSCTAPVVEASLSASEISPLHRVVGVLREIADAAALRSCVWARAGELPSLPTRAGIELFIRLYDVDDWAEEQGHHLDLESDGIPDDVWPDGEEQEVAEDELVEVWTTICEPFDGIHELQEEVATARDEHRLQLREGACGLIYGARSWASWARRVAPTEGEAVVGSALFMAEALYIVSAQRVANPALFPSRGFLREFLTDTGGLDWLAEHGADVPDWLT